MAAPHPAPQLVELGEAELVGAIHHHRVGVRHVEARFHDHRRDQDVHLAADEPRHHGVQLRFRQLPVRDRDSRARCQPPHPPGDGRDRLDAVVHEIHLAAPVEFARERLFQQRVVPRLDERQHRGAVLRRRLQQREVPQPREREMQRARDRRRGEGEYVYRQLQGL